MSKIRCSAADRAIACSGSLLPVEHPYDPPSGAGTEGTAGHECIESIVNGQVTDVAEVAEPAAERYGCDLSSLTYLVGEAWRAWGELAEMFPNPQTERKLDGPLCYGRADVVSYGVDHAAVLDWKFGYRGDRHDSQLLAYASCLRDEVGMPSRGWIDAVEVHVRLGTWHHARLTDDDISVWEDQLRRHIAKPGSQWAPSTSACMYCPSRMACPARAGYALASADLIAGVAEDCSTERDALAQVYDRAESLRQILREYDDAVGDALRDGPLRLPDGRTVELVETTRDKINVTKAWPILRAGLGWDAADLLSCVSVGKGALVRRIQDGAPRGQKKQRSDEVMAELVNGAAVSRETSMVKKTRVPG